MFHYDDDAVANLAQAKLQAAMDAAEQLGADFYAVTLHYGSDSEGRYVYATYRGQESSNFYYDTHEKEANHLRQKESPTL